MSASKVKGRNVVLKAMRVLDATYYGFYCAQEVTFEVTTEQMPATGPDSGSFRRFKPGKTSWRITLTGVTFVKDISDSLWDPFDLTDEQARQEGVGLQIIYTNENGATEDFQGHANPENVSITGSTPGGALSKFNVVFQGDGLYGRNASVPPSNNDEVQRYFYQATGGETNITVPALINKTILEFERETGTAFDIITSGTPNPKQVKYTAASGAFDLDTNNPLGAGENIVILYR